MLHNLCTIIGASTILIGGGIGSLYLLAVITECINKKNKIKYKRELNKKQMFNILRKVA